MLFYLFFIILFIIMKLQKLVSTTCMKERDSWRGDHRAGVTIGCFPTLLCSNIVFQHESDVNWTQIICKSSNSAKLLSHLFSPWITYLFHYLFIGGLIHENYSFYVYGSFACMYYITCMPGTLWDQKLVWIPVAGVASDVVLSCGSWELNLVLEQQ